MKNEKTEQPKNEGRLVTEDEAGIRLDRWFKRHFPDLTHGELERLLRSGQVRRDGKRAESSDRLEAGQALRIPPFLINPTKGSESVKGVKSLRGIKSMKDLILFEDEDVVAINKPAGLAVQGGTGLKENLDDVLMAFSLDGVTKPKLVHRLDRDTSGVLLIARTAFAATPLAESFRKRETQKIYWGVILGVPKQNNGRIDAALQKRGETMVVVKGSGGGDNGDVKSASTLYHVVEKAKKKASFVALWPLTGRTHQLRAHMKHIGTPLLGDKMYGGDHSDQLPLSELGEGLHLHARRLILPHPRKGNIDVTAPLGAAMQKTFTWFGFDATTEYSFKKGGH